MLLFALRVSHCDQRGRYIAKQKNFSNVHVHDNAARGKVMKKVRVVISYSWLCISTNRPCLSD